MTKRTLFKFLAFLLFTVGAYNSSIGQLKSNDSAFILGKAGTSRFYTAIYLDYYYKAHSDPLTRGIGVNQYSGIPSGRNAFAFRRIYLGFDHNISKRFTTELLLAAEDELVETNSAGSTQVIGDFLPNNKYTFYIKQANLRWKNIWKNADLLVGQAASPAFPLLTQKIWGYRPIEKTIADIRKTPSFDLGISIQAKMDTDGNFGYNLMIGNGTGARPENDKFKWFYGDVFGMFFNKKIVFDLYVDYTRLNWVQGFHHSRNMIKGLIAYNTKPLTIGVEAFINNGKKDVVANGFLNADTLNAVATGISGYVHGKLFSEKVHYIIRYDVYNPDKKYDNKKYLSYKGFSPTFDPSNKEYFFTAGIDITILPNVHLIPNIWYNKFVSQQTKDQNSDYDLVYRLTVSYSFGK